MYEYIIQYLPNSRETVSTDLTKSSLDYLFSVMSKRSVHAGSDNTVFPAQQV